LEIQRLFYCLSPIVMMRFYLFIFEQPFIISTLHAMRYLLILLLFNLTATAYSQDSNYHEKHRPQFHFSPPAHWMNDPNGMVYYKGEYHLFYQYYPDSTVWGPMHWGHAITTDLVHWKHLPVALFPDSLGLIFSGSVVVDEHNTSGLQNGVEKPLVALFTYHDMKKEKAGASDFQYQGMAYSLDKGRSWKKYEHNPVIKNLGTKDFRDPKVFWHAASKHWIMTLAVANRVEFYRSKNLKEWTFAGTFGKEDGNHGGVWECPDMFEITVDKTGEKKWVLIVSVGTGAPNGGSGTQYFVGQFNGSTFVNDNSKETVYWLDYGPDDYAGVTWSNTANGRHLFLGWMSNWNYAQKVPTQRWRSAMTVPRELSLKKTGSGYRLFSNPVKNLAVLRTSTQVLKGTAKTILKKGLYEINLVFNNQQSTADDYGISFLNDRQEQINIGYNKTLNQFYIDRSNAGHNSFSTTFTGKNIAPRLFNDKLVKMQLLVDQSSIELFADDGSVLMTALFFPGEILTDVQVYGHNGKALLQQGILHELKSVW